MARIKFTLLKAERSPGLSYSQMRLEITFVLWGHFQHVNLYSLLGQQEMKEEKKTTMVIRGGEKIYLVSCSRKAKGNV